MQTENGYLQVIALRGGSQGSQSFTEPSDSTLAVFSDSPSGDVITALLDELMEVSDARELALLNAPDDKLSAILYDKRIFNRTTLKKL